MFYFPKNKDLVFIDIEANDKPKRILQFGALKLKTNGEIEVRNWFSNPKCKISKHIHSMLKKNIKNIENGMSASKIFDKIFHFIKDCIVITYGSFDYMFLKESFKKRNKKNDIFNFIDLQDEWRKFCCSKNVWGLSKLANFFNIPISQEKFHDAFYDAELLYKIFCAWNESDDCHLSAKLSIKTITDSKRIKISQNKENKNSITINNTTKNKGVCFLNILFQKSQFIESTKKLLYKLDILEIVGSNIKTNISFYFDLNECFEIENYEHWLNKTLKKFLEVIKDKKIVIKESDYQYLIKLCNLAAKFIDIFPINDVFFNLGYANFYNKIEYSVEKYMNNLDLIKNWKVYKYLNEKKEN